MNNGLRVGAWLPNDWGRMFTDEEKSLIAESGIDLLLVPENHDQWDNRDVWRRIADELDVALYAGFEDGDWVRGIFYDPAADTEFTYTKHSTAGKLALEQDSWDPSAALKTTDLQGTTVGTTICHDHYFSPLMGYEGLAGASLLVNLSASPVQRKKWGEVLQARAIENSAYVVCTMHGTKLDGSTGGGNAHVFAFDPFGDQINLTELGTGEDRPLFETEPDNIYAFTVDPSKATEAEQTLTDQENRPPIDRVKTNAYDKPGSSDTTLDVRAHEEELELTYADESVTIQATNSGCFDFGGEQFYVVTLNGSDIFEPEQLYTDLLSVDKIENKTILIHNRWEEVSEHYIENVVEPVLRARTVEWASPTLLTNPSESRGYQAWYTKSTHRLPPDETGQFNFDVRWATGVETALSPINNRYNEMLEVVKICQEQRELRS